MTDLTEFSNPELASTNMSSYLADGTLVLFLGAGASKYFGLPGWFDLVNSLRENVGLKKLESYTNAEDLQRAADDVLDIIKSEEKLIDAIEDVLYAEMKSLSTTDIFSNPLLLAVSAMLMGSKRGHVTRVVTLNYDDLLQWFLSVYGFSVRTIHSLPELEGAEDVRIYHPHGFIPMKDSGIPRSTNLILGLDSANRRLGTLGDPWLEMLRHIIDSGMCLFIGMSPDSLSDRVLQPIFSTSAKKIQGKRPLGFWIVKDTLTPSKKAEFQRNNIVPLEMHDPQEIANFLIEICQKAGRKLNK